MLCSVRVSVAYNDPMTLLPICLLFLLATPMPSQRPTVYPLWTSFTDVSRQGEFMESKVWPNYSSPFQTWLYSSLAGWPQVSWPCLKEVLSICPMYLLSTARELNSSPLLKWRVLFIRCLRRKPEVYNKIYIAYQTQFYLIYTHMHAHMSRKLCINNIWAFICIYRSQMVHCHLTVLFRDSKDWGVLWIPLKIHG